MGGLHAPISLSSNKLTATPASSWNTSQADSLGSISEGVVYRLWNTLRCVLLRSFIYDHFKNADKTSTPQWLCLSDFDKWTRVRKLARTAWIWCTGHSKWLFVEGITIWFLLTIYFGLFPNGDYRTFCHLPTWTMAAKAAIKRKYSSASGKWWRFG